MAHCQHMNFLLRFENAKHMSARRSREYGIGVVRGKICEFVNGALMLHPKLRVE